MKILFISNSEEDYLADSLMHGFRKLFNENLIDYPKNSLMYISCSEAIKEKIRGKGFTLYYSLENLEIDRSNINNRLRNNAFDLIIFSSIHRQFGIFHQFIKYLTYNNTITVDGEDTPALYPYNGFFWRRPAYWFLPRAHKRFKYFKREWTPETKYYRYFKVVPKGILKFFPEPKNLHKISFSIPEEKIIKVLPEKTKLFPKHIVDEEVAPHIDGSKTSYVFENEADYYRDLQQSKFGITTKRSGWDCLRHYEITANGSVICFRDLDQKPRTCAPHGLIHNVNCISYKNYNDLLKQISSITDEKYNELQQSSLNWIKNNTTVIRAKELLIEFGLIIEDN